MTDTKCRGLYVLQILQTLDEDAKIESNEKSSSDDDQNVSSSSSSDAKQTAFIKSITEFPLSSPILSFGIVNATVRKYKCAYNDAYLLEDLDDYDEDSLNRYCVVIHLFLVQPKSVQECHVLYQPTLTLAAEVGSSITALSDATNEIEGDLLKDIKSIIVLKSPNENDISAGSSNSSIINATKNLLETNLLTSNGGSVSNLKTSPALIKTENNLSQQSIHSTSNKPATLNLMTPDSFHSSGKITPEGVSNEVYSALRMLAGEKPVDGTNLLHLVNNKVIEEQEQKKYIQQAAELGSASGSNSSVGSHKAQTIVPPMPPSSMLAAAGVSGGSSPSREVQEILSLKDSDCMNDFYHDSMDIQDDTDGSGNNVDVADANNADPDVDDEEKNSNRDDDDTYTLSNGTVFLQK